MIKKIILIILLPIFVFAKPVRLADINDVMNLFFNYHIEHKSFEPHLIQRSFKLYIDQFDPSKIYLLESEVLPYVNLSKNDSKKILENINRDDFSDFNKLNKLIIQSIIRAQNNRKRIANILFTQNIDADSKYVKYNDFASNLNELHSRQSRSLVKYYESHKNQVVNLTDEKKQKIFSLLERRLIRKEKNYFNDNANHLQKENMLSMNILKAMAKSLDSHTAYFSDDEAYEMRLSLENEFEGVGLILSESVEGVMVTDLIKNSPADESGLIKRNDIIVEIDGNNVENRSFDEVMKLMKKKENENIILGFKRILHKDDIAKWRVKLIRKPISLDDQRLTYSYEKTNNGVIGKLNLLSFYENSSGVTSEKDIIQALKELKRQGPIKGLVLDLRENGGGFLSQAIKVVSLFISNGVVVISKNHKNEIRYLRAIDGNTEYNGPLIILTSKLSASASEIVAKSLQDYGVALVVGDKTTFGKGSIQYQTITDKNADLFYKVTIGKYYTVSGETTQIKGVEADVVVPTQYAVYKVGEKYLDYPLKNDKVNPAYDDDLSDLDSKIRFWFKENYKPTLQKKVTYWQNMVPVLKENSEHRLSKDSSFQNFLKKQEIIKQKLDGKEVDIQFTEDNTDIQMKEAVNILRDMIYLKENNRKASGF
ncbi:MAG: Tail-specific protease [Candidatus Anoxychlamydiales bacterium]|nr:Tail-specific protease [Candidatus Anoxychlamydiales bacterium]